MLFPMLCMVATANEPIRNLVVWAKDGAKVAYTLAEKPKITFTETDLVIKTKGIEVNYPLGNMLRFTYDSSAPTAITDLKTEEETFKFEGNSLLFPFLKANDNVSVYSADGSLVLMKTVRKDGEFVMSVSDLNAGVYLVKVNSVTYKILKK